MTCPSCGAENAGGANFCSSCGNALRPQGDATTVIDPIDDDETSEDVADPDATDPDATTVVPAASRGLRTCPACGAPNAPARSICGRCGADLATGEVAPIPSGTYAPPSRDERGDRTVDDESEDSEDSEDTAPRPSQRDRHRRPGRRRRTWMIAGAVIVVGVLIGVLAGMLVALNGGDGDDEQAIPPAPVFDQGTYPDEPGGISVARLGASTTNTVAGEELSVARLVDGDLDTAWENDGTENPNGVGEQVVIEFTEAAWIDSIVVGNGAQESDSRYLGDARLKRVRVTFDGDDVITALIADLRGLQVIELPTPVLTTGLRLAVLEVYQGDTYQELGVSELRFNGWVAVDADASVASERATDRG